LGAAEVIEGSYFRFKLRVLFCGCWLLAAGYLLLAAGYWRLAAGPDPSGATGFWLTYQINHFLKVLNLGQKLGLLDYQLPGALNCQGL